LRPLRRLTPVCLLQSGLESSSRLVAPGLRIPRRALPQCAPAILRLRLFVASLSAGLAVSGNRPRPPETTTSGAALVRHPARAIVRAERTLAGIFIGLSDAPAGVAFVRLEGRLAVDVPHSGVERLRLL